LAKLTVPNDFSNIADMNEFKRYVSQFVGELVSIINGKIEFGGINFLSQSVDVVFSNANTDQAITHQLNKTGVKYIVTSKSQSCDVYTGNAKATTNTIYLRCTQTATVSLELF
jgi:hypothetical protein